MAENVLKGIQVQIGANATPFATEMDKAARIARQKAAEMRRAIEQEMAESKHSLHLLGDAFGVHVPRAIRGFISELPGVSKAMSLAFDGLAIIVVIKVIQEAVEKVKEFTEGLDAAKEAGKHIAEGFEKVAAPLEAANHQLELSITKTENAIAKLEHKPQNHLAEGLAEAAVKADQLNSKLQAAAENARKVLEGDKGKQGWWQRMFGNSKGTDQAEDLQKRIDHMLGSLPHDENYNSVMKSFAGSIWKDAQQQLKKNEYEAFFDRDKDFSRANNALYGIQRWASETQHLATNSDRENDEQERQRIAQERKDSSERAQRATHKADEDERRNIGIILEGLPTANARYDRLLQLPAVRKGNEDWAYGVMNPETHVRQGGLFAKNRVEAQKEDERQDEADLRALNQYNNKLNEAQQKSITLYAKYAAGQEQAIKAAGQNSVQWIAFNEKTGNLSQPEAAKQTTAAHSEEFAFVMAWLVSARDHIANEDTRHMTKEQVESHNDRLSLANNKIDNAQNAFDLQSANDKFNETVQTATAGLHQFFVEFERDADNAASAVHSALAAAANSFNQEIANAVMGKRTNWSGALQGVGSHLIQSGLKTAESGLMKAFGLGKQQHVIVDNMPDGGMAGGAGSSMLSSLGHNIAGAFSKIGHLFGTVFGGFFADGGSPDPYKTSVVGENGPELFVPKIAGTVIPNKSLRGFGGDSGPSIAIGSIDARGTNAADVDRRVREGSLRAYQQAMRDSQAQHVEHNARVPAHSRS